jgi:dihydroxy-acid dehydratase
MPEMYFASAIIAADPALNHTTALITDGRYSGAMKGPCIGHVTPEAIDGGPIALVEDGDLIEINIPERRFGIVGVGKRSMDADAIERVLAERRARWTPPPFRHTRGILSLYSRVAAGSAQGALMTPRDGAKPDAVPAAAEPISRDHTIAVPALRRTKRA